MNPESPCEPFHKKPPFKNFVRVYPLDWRVAPYRWPKLIILASWVMYALVFPSLYGVLSGEAVALVVLPMTITAAVGGLRWGLAAGAVAFTLNQLLLFALGGLAPDWLPVSLPDLVVSVFIGGVVGYLRDVRLRLIFYAQHDALTGLHNRAAFTTRLERALARTPAQSAASLLFVDLDGFKLVNDKHGHAVGDALLREVAERLRGSLRRGDLAGRLGGDEFTVLLANLAKPDQGAEVAQKLLEALTAPYRLGEKVLNVGTSIGVAHYPLHAGDADALIGCADSAMYRAKYGGKNHCQVFDGAAPFPAHGRTEARLRDALERGEFRLHYQPQFDLQSGSIEGVEALARWEHPERGLVPPDEFIPVAERTGLIVPLGAFVLREACRQAKAWERAGSPPLRVAVNVSALQFAQDDFVASVARCLEESGLEARWLELEITESLLMQDVGGAVTALHRLRALGVQVAIDDFGTGYSSLAYLQKLPIQRLKIDRSFLFSLDDAPLSAPHASSEAAILTAITNLAHNLGKRVVAEGVETPSQKLFLREIGCDTAQGFLFAKPLPAPEVARLLEGRASPKDTDPGRYAVVN